MNNLDQLYKQVILEHSKHPYNKGLVDKLKSYTKHNSSCGDKVTVQVQHSKGVIKDIFFDGSGCAISMASASMLTQVLKNKTINEAKDIINDYTNLVSGKSKLTKYDLNDALAMQGVSNYPARFKCATLAWEAVSNALNEIK